MVRRDGLAHRVTDYIDSMHSGLSSAVSRLLSIALLLLSISLLSIGLLSTTLIGRVLLQRLRPCLLLRWVHLERQEPAELTRGATDLAANTGMTKEAANSATQWLTNMSEEITEEALRRDGLPLLPLLRLLGLQLLKLLQLLLPLLLLRELRVSLCDGILLEGQQTAQLTCDAANLSAQPRLSENAADGTACRLTILSDQISEPSLWR